jgi:hypothetical protein
MAGENHRGVCATTRRESVPDALLALDWKNSFARASASRGPEGKDHQVLVGNSRSPASRLG